jgi:hypothetical protein
MEALAHPRALRQKDHGTCSESLRGRLDGVFDLWTGKRVTRPQESMLYRGEGASMEKQIGNSQPIEGRAPRRVKLTK